MRHEVVMCIGSNLHPRGYRVTEAIAEVSGLLEDPESSHVYETPEIHGSGRSYRNAVMRGSTSLSFDLLNQKLKGIEFRLGRDAAARARGDVPVDIDIVMWDGEVVRPKDFEQDFFRIGALAIQTGIYESSY